ncbi:MAG: transposase [Deltaproteobacteria bacterium]|nr:MAG: transposase [Deltaproteobacteria bacterium]
MPRKARIDAPGALHHIIVRGIERKSIFRGSQDYHNFLRRLGNVLEETQTPCFGWALMPNHLHLLLRTGYMPISKVMLRLLTGYAQQFNRRHRRHGQLFQNRFKSVLCEENPYLLELVRYIHLNPIRAKIVEDIKSLKRFPYCGHGVLMGKHNYDWQDTDYVLRMFGQHLGSARRAYNVFVAKGISDGRRPELVGGGFIRSAGGWSALKVLRSKATRIMGDERILGSSNFVKTVLKRANEDYERKTKALAQGRNLDDIVEAVSEYFNIEPDSMRGTGKQRKASLARSVICYLAVNKLKISGREVSRQLGLSPSAVSKARIRGRSNKRSELIWKKLLESEN